MRQGTDSESIRGAQGVGVNRASSKKKRHGSGVSLPIAMWASLEQVDEALLFQERIKSSNVSKIIELAIKELFDNQPPDEVAKRIANDIRKLSR